MVINWHDRSLAPDRLWEATYQHLLAETDKDGRTWFATAAEAVTWFQWRRSIRFEVSGSATVVHGSELPAGLPAAHIAIHRSPSSAPVVEDFHFDGREALTVTM